MPGPSHAAIVDLLAGRLDVVLELLRLAGVERPPFDYLEQATESLAPSQLGPFLPDLVVRLMRRRSDGPPECVGVLVIEVQVTFDATKVRSWSLYGPLSSALFRAPAQLIVVTPSEPVAAWARALPEYGSVLARPLVVGPSELAALLPEPGALGEPLPVELAVLAAVAHAQGPSAGRALEFAITSVAGLGEDERIAHFLDMLSEQFGVRVKDLWEAMMPATVREYQSEWIRGLMNEGVEKGMQQGMQQGMQRGLVAGRAEAILVLLRARGCAVSEADADTIRSTTDLTELDRWLVRAAEARSTAELFVR